MLQRLAEHAQRRRSARALILAPTRELAVRSTRASAYGRHLQLTSAVIFGGVNQNQQVKALKRRRRHPGRHARPPARPLQPAACRLDRCDPRARRGRPHARHGLHPRRAEDRRRLPRKRQTLLFSATMPPAKSPSSPTTSCATRCGSRWRRRPSPWTDRAARLLRRTEGQARAARPACSRIKRSSACSCSPAPSMAPTGRATAEAGRRPGRRHHGNKSQNARSARSRTSARQGAGSGGDRHRGARHRRARHLPRHQFRPARRGRELRAPHRPHRARRCWCAALSFCDQSERPYLKAIEQLMQRKVTAVDHRLVEAPSEAHPGDAEAQTGRRRTQRVDGAAGTAPRIVLKLRGPAPRIVPKLRGPAPRIVPKRRGPAPRIFPKSPCWQHRPPERGQVSRHSGGGHR